MGKAAGRVAGRGVSWLLGALIDVLVVTHCVEARAQEAAAVELPEPRLLREGDRAPFTGQLILQADLLRWAMRIEALEHRLEVDVRTERERCDVRLDLERARTTAASDTRALHDALYETRIQELAAALNEARRSAERQPWESPALWFAVGAVVAAGAAIGLAAAL